MSEQRSIAPASSAPERPAVGGKGTPRGERIRVAIISNSLPPYRLRLHQRLAAQMPELELFSLFTHEAQQGLWAYDPSAEINPVMFGRGEQAVAGHARKHLRREWRKGGRIIRWLREQGVAAVVINGYDDPGRLRVAWWCRRRGIPCFVRGDSNILLETTRGMRARLKRFVLPQILRLFTGVFAVGSNGVAFFEHYGVPRKHIHLLPFAPGYDRIEAITPEQIEQARQAYGWSDQRRRIVFTGRLVPIKRVDLIIDAFIRLAEQRPQWDLVIVGDGQDRQALEARVPASLHDRVTWTGFLSDQDQISAIHRACDVLVIASSREPWALVVNEAAAAGLAIVSSDIVGAAADLVHDGVNGRVFATDDMHALVEALLDVTRDEKIDQFKAGSRQVLTQWREQHSPEQGLREALRACGLLG